MNLFRPTRTTNLRGKRYRLMIINNFLKFIWILFLAQKDETFSVFTKFYQKISNEKNLIIIYIRSDYETKFKIQYFKNFCNKKSIEHNFSTLKTPQQNRISERKNRVIMERARCMLKARGIPKFL